MREMSSQDRHPSRLASTAARYRQPFEDMWWQAGPAVLDALDNVPNHFPRQIDTRLRDWIVRMTSDDPVPALQVPALDRGLRDLAVLHLSSYDYRLSPDWTAELPLACQVVRIDRGCALSVCRAQHCVAEIACVLHGNAGMRTWLSALEHERVLRRQIAERIVALVEGAR